MDSVVDVATIGNDGDSGGASRPPPSFQPYQVEPILAALAQLLSSPALRLGPQTEDDAVLTGSPADAIEWAQGVQGLSNRLVAVQLAAAQAPADQALLSPIAPEFAGLARDLAQLAPPDPEPIDLREVYARRDQADPASSGFALVDEKTPDPDAVLKELGRLRARVDALEAQAKEEFETPEDVVAIVQGFEKVEPCKQQLEKYGHVISRFSNTGYHIRVRTNRGLLRNERQRDALFRQLKSNFCIFNVMRAADFDRDFLPKARLYSFHILDPKVHKDAWKKGCNSPPSDTHKVMDRSGLMTHLNYDYFFVRPNTSFATIYSLSTCIYGLTLNTGTKEFGGTWYKHER